MSRRDLSYELPSLVEYTRQGWQSTCSSAAVVTSLLAAVAAGLLSVIHDVANDDDFKQNANPRALTAVYITSFGAIILNASATITSLLLIDELGDLPDIASADPDKPKAGFVNESQDLLVYYGMKRTWTWTRWHWIISLILGVWCLFTQVVIFACISQTKAVKVTVTAVTVFAVLPMCRVFPKFSKIDARSSPSSSKGSEV
ncbi:uncharacterized protein EV420DRAFT_68891 [Desarmillaria tabescens]|uniref:Uncharacterized protein n=1 Tax=Armillaria tabescens TaxID=1929756 RepID=A0AA39NQT4_ARMTA|nr:uncharacterized protein EV420DRAFT_68891 [Desarmillaria tabescens]KAK0469823.1 hypothetical protein EV420DRAFT_68891 [Desarmillaria tabescens]